MSIREHVSSVLCVYACVAFLVPRYDLPFPGPHSLMPTLCSDGIAHFCTGVDHRWVAHHIWFNFGLLGCRSWLWRSAQLWKFYSFGQPKTRKTTPKQTPSSSPSTSLLAPHHHSWPQCCNRYRSDNGWYEFICPNKLHKWHYSREGKSDWTKSHLWVALLCVCVSTWTCLWTWACLYYPELLCTQTYDSHIFNIFQYVCVCVYHILYTCNHIEYPLPF